jgi:hypothetical protein
VSIARAIVVLLICLAAGRSNARINVVNLPGRDSVQLTIYNSVDLTLVRETRLLTFRKGLNRLEFSWANTLIDPTSVEFRAVTHADALDVLDVSFPPRVSDTLEWRIQSDFAGEAEIEIRYFTSGIRWTADYVAESAPNEQAMQFAGNVRVDNKSGEDYENAQIRLIVGVVRLVEEIVQLARQNQPKNAPTTRLLAEEDESRKRAFYAFNGAMALGLEAAKQKEIVKEALSEYFLYTVEGRDTVPNGWSKRLPSFRAADVPLVSFYKYEKEQTGDAVQRYYRFTNSPACHLGKEPLPDGVVKAFNLRGADKLYAYVGSSALKYVPVNEQVDLELGRDAEVQVKPKLIDWQKTNLQFDNRRNVSGWTTKETWEIELQNSKSIDALIDIRRNFAGDWSVTTDQPYEALDAKKIKFLIPLKAGERKTFTYTLTTRHGTSATR